MSTDAPQPYWLGLSRGARRGATLDHLCHVDERECDSLNNVHVERRRYGWGRLLVRDAHVAHLHAAVGAVAEEAFDLEEDLPPPRAPSLESPDPALPVLLPTLRMNSSPN